jgi:hypothetical protein
MQYYMTHVPFSLNSFCLDAFNNCDCTAEEQLYHVKAELLDTLQCRSLVTVSSCYETP